ncbi:EamA family transporter [soil metagenome]
MTIWSRDLEPGRRGRRTSLVALCLGLPLLGLGYQVASKFTALALHDTPFGPAWVIAALSQPWGPTLLVIEGLSLGAWMIVLAEIKLSAAFPMLALGYLLVMGAGWALFREPVSALQVLGGVAILGGVWLISRERP